MTRKWRETAKKWLFWPKQTINQLMNCKMQALKEEVRDKEKRRTMETRVKKRNPTLVPSNKNSSHIEEGRQK